MRVLLLTGPMVQINTPYPATAYLTAYLRREGYEAHQEDPALELVLRLFSRSGVERALKEVKKNLQFLPENPALDFFLEAGQDYAATAEAAVSFLQGRNPELATAIAARNFFPEGPRFQQLQETAELFAALNENDRARHVTSLYLDDLADYIRDGVDPFFAFARYGEELAASQVSFTPLLERLEGDRTLIDEILTEIATDLFRIHKPEVLGLSVPFSGSLYGALRLAQAFRKLSPATKIVMGGGYPNTELRSLSDPRIFKYVDFITLDDGEKPLEILLEFFAGERRRGELLRTFTLDSQGRVEWINDQSQRDIPFAAWPPPTYEGLPLKKYIRMLESLNPMLKIWHDFHWNKLTLAHGCYWRKCSFCDTSLDYIQRYEASPADLILDRMEALIRETGHTGFHFVDEAAPPKILAELARGIIARGLKVSWWGNIRFDKSFTRELTQLLADSGCIAVTGGLEVASDRILKLINKGVTIEQVARVTKNFSDAGVLVHAYLMYGFPTQTTQETVDSLEVVRQLFAQGCLQSGFWHRFTATVHSPVGRFPEKFGVLLQPEAIPSEGLFAQNDVPFKDPTPTPHDELGEGLRKALYNYMYGIGLELPVTDWFDCKVPKAELPRDLIQRALRAPQTQLK